MKRPLFWIGICLMVLTALLYNCNILPETFFSFPTFDALAEYREQITDLIIRKFNIDAAGILCAILIGDKSYLTSDISNHFNLCGMSHILVVSGMHLVTTTTLIKAFLKKLSLKKRFIILIIFIWLYVLITGCGVSTIRAALMLTIIEIGSIFKRKSDNLTSLAIAGIIISLISPGSVMTHSFILSFSSVLGICLFSKYVNESVAAQIGTLPAVAVFFGYVPLFGFLANIIVVPLLSPILVLGMIFLVIPQIYPILNIFIKTIILVSKIFSKIPRAYLGVGSPWQKLIILTIYFFIAYCIAIKPSKTFIKKVSALLISFTLIANIWALLLVNQIVTVIEFRKENIQVFALGSHAIIFNCPTSYEVNSLTYYLRANNITNIDAIVVEESVIPNSLYSFIKYNKVDRIIAPNATSNSGVKLFDETFSRESVYDIMKKHGYKFRTKIEKLD